MRTFVVVGVQSGRGCGDFWGALSAVFELKAKPVVLGTYDERFEPTAVIDVGGKVQVVVKDPFLDSPAGIFEIDEDGLEEVVPKLAFPVHDGC